MYDFAIISHFDDSFTEEIRELQKEISALTGSKASLEKNNPHLTVGDEILVKESDLENLYRNLQKITEDFSPTSVKIEGFDYLDNWKGGSLPYTPYVVYLKVTEYFELEKIVSNIKEEVTDNYEKKYHQPYPYKPHITLAYKDLTKEGFDNAKEYLSSKNFSKSTIIDHFSLATKDNKGRWVEFKKFNLGSKN